MTGDDRMADLITCGATYNTSIFFRSEQNFGKPFSFQLRQLTLSLALETQAFTHPFRVAPQNDYTLEGLLSAI